MVIKSNDEAQSLFRTTELLDFAVEDDREITIYRSDSGTPTTYLVKKYVNAYFCRT